VENVERNAVVEINGKPLVNDSIPFDQNNIKLLEHLIELLAVAMNGWVRRLPWFDLRRGKRSDGASSVQTRNAGIYPSTDDVNPDCVKSRNERRAHVKCV